MVKKLSCLLIPAVFLFALGGCKKSNEYPIEPVITFKALSIVKDNQGFDDKVVLEITFTDGDGDIGLDASDTLSPYTGQYVNNVFVLFYCDSTGNGFIPWPQFDDKGRIPVVTPEGNTKAIRGEIKKGEIFLPNGRTNLPVRFEVFIYDRALHQSNKITTPAIVITSQ